MDRKDSPFIDWLVENIIKYPTIPLLNMYNRVYGQFLLDIKRPLTPNRRIVQLDKLKSEKGYEDVTEQQYVKHLIKNGDVLRRMGQQQ
jgi:hypothetical protein